MKVVGLMSGTSYDAIDVAVAEFARKEPSSRASRAGGADDAGAGGGDSDNSGVEDDCAGDVVTMRVLGALEHPYPADVAEVVARVLPPGTVSIGDVCQLDTELGQVFAAAAERGIAELADGQADLVVSHGQTVFHWVQDGRSRGSLQLGQPAWIAERTGVPVLSDLRNRDIAAGGQGAPLVPIFDALLLPPNGVPRAALNIGGIANMTVLCGPESLAYDLGPGNALIDAAARRFLGQPRDRDGRVAASGSVDEELLAVLLAEPYYARTAPKSTGKELFNADYLDRHLAAFPRVSGPDVLATVTELTARVVAEACRAYGVGEVVVSGGGVRNGWLMYRLAETVGSGARIRIIDEYGIPSDAKEAYAFAALGYLTVHGMPVTRPGWTGARAGSIVGSVTPGDRPLELPYPWQDAPRALRVATREDHEA